MESYSATPRTKVARKPQRGVYDKAEIHAILDEGFLCHVGFVVDGQPYVLPTGYVRVGEQIYLHGSTASRMLHELEQGIKVCVNVTIMDGFVLARSAFHHSMNYRSVVILGTAQLVTEPEEKREALRHFTNHIVPGRWDEARQPSEQELKGTSVLVLPLEEVSAKVRKGPPIDDEEDYEVPVWAGVVPLHLQVEEPIPDNRLHSEAVAVDIKRFARFQKSANKTKDK